MIIQEVDLETVWEIRQKVMWPDKDVSFIQIQGDAEARHLGVFVDQQCLSVISLFINQDSIQFRKFATRMEAQGKGYGSALLKHVLANYPHKKIWCNARTQKLNFYAKFGFKTAGDPFEKEGISYINMHISA